MIILALDPSTKSTGYAVYDDQELIAHGCISAGSSNLFKRISRMTEEIKKLFDKHDIKKVVIEEVLPEDVRGNQTVFKALMYLQAYIMGTLDELEVETKFYVASAWRAKCGIHTGRGIKRESLKPQDIKFVQNQFGIKVNDDEADAICIGFAEVGGTIKQPQIIIEDGFEFA
jgi:Holliday junction resolvasome RuvABC endonuclease subunit